MGSRARIVGERRAPGRAALVRASRSRWGLEAWRNRVSGAWGLSNNWMKRTKPAMAALNAVFAAKPGVMRTSGEQGRPPWPRIR
jgi:hypothetical protein